MATKQIAQDTSAPTLDQVTARLATLRDEEKKLRQARKALRSAAKKEANAHKPAPGALVKVTKHPKDKWVGFVGRAVLVGRTHFWVEGVEDATKRTRIAFDAYQLAS